MYRYNKKLALSVIIVLLFTLFFPLFNTKVQADVTTTTAKMIGARSNYDKKRGGLDGENGAKEVAIGNYANNDWQRVYRYPDSSVAEMIVKLAAQAANNNYIGYQMNSYRYTFYNELVKTYDINSITTVCDTDCSAFVCTICSAVGHLKNIPELEKLASSSSIPSTDTMKNAMPAAGFQTLAFNDVKDSLKTGDILWRPAGNGHSTGHTEIFAGGIVDTSGGNSWSNYFGGANVEVDDKTVNLDDINFEFAGSPKKVTYNGEIKLSKLVFTYVGQFFDFIINTIINSIKYSILGWAFAIESMTNGTIKSLEGDSD